MKKFVVALTLILGLLSGVASAQTDPRDQSPIVLVNQTLAGTEVTSDTYANILSAAGETLWFQILGTLVGSWTIEGTIDSEANVLAGTATWTTILTSTTFPAAPWVSDPMPYIRLRVTSTGACKVLMRGSVGTSFRFVRTNPPTP